jgi:hypothetical protein
MSELDLLNLARGATAVEMGYFTQMITINFAMIVAIFYFLEQSRLAMRLFAFAAYSVGMLLFLSEMLFETSFKFDVLTALRALPHANMVTTQYVGLYSTWVTTVTTVTINGAIWILWLGTAYMLFFWRKDPRR